MIRNTDQRPIYLSKRQRRNRSQEGIAIRSGEYEILPKKRGHNASAIIDGEGKDLWNRKRDLI